MSSHVYLVALPLPPSVNASLRPARLGNAVRLVHTREAKEWMRHAALVLAAYPAPADFRTGVLRLDVSVYVGSIASDATNRIKLLEDALVRAGIMEDDRQVVEVSITKVVSRSPERVEVRLTHADPAKHQEAAIRLEKAEKKHQPKRGT